MTTGHKSTLLFFWGGGIFYFLNAFELEHFPLRCPVLSKTLFSAAGVVSLLHFARPSLPCFEVSCVQSSPLHFISGCISTHCIWFERITPHIPCAVHSLWGSAVTLLQLSCPSLILRQLFSAGQSLRPSFCFCSLCIFILADFLIQHLLHLLPFKSSPISLPYFSAPPKTMRMRMTL